MALIKQADVAAGGSVLNLGDIALEARAILDQARRQGEQVLAEAAQAADQVRLQARQAGYEEGLAAGQAEGQRIGRDQAAAVFEQQIARTGRALADSLDQFNAAKGRVLAQARQDMVALALAVAEKVLRCRLAADPDACRRTVEAAVELAGRASRLTLRVHPQDLATVQAFGPQLAERLAGSAQVQVSPDETIEPGGCRLLAWREGGQPSEVDGTIGTQLDRLAGELLGRGEPSGGQE